MADSPFDASYQVFEVVRNCARTELLAHHKEQITALFCEGVDWKDVFEVAIRQGIRPLVQKNVLATYPGVIPEEDRAKLIEIERAAAMHNIFLVKEMGRLMKYLAAKDVSALALKGPALAQMAYGDINLRSYVDLDLYVKKKDFDRVERLLQEDGYAALRKISGLMGIPRRLYVWQSGQLSFRRGASVFYVDLHRDIMPPLYYYMVDFETFWRRSESLVIAGTEVRSCIAEDVLQILCYHGAKNRWEAMKYICDVAELIRSNEQLDWDFVLASARKTRGERILFLGLYLAHLLLEATLPAEIVQRMHRDKQLRGIASHLIEHLPIHRQEISIGLRERLLFHLNIQDTFATKLRYSYFALQRRMIGLIYPSLVEQS